MLLLLAMIPTDSRALALEELRQWSKTYTPENTNKMFFSTFAGDVLNHFHECHNQCKMKTTGRINPVIKEMLKENSDL